MRVEHAYAVNIFCSTYSMLQNMYMNMCMNMHMHACGAQ